MVNKDLEQIANFSTRSEKTSWNRKLDNMIKLMAQLEPIEKKILKIMQTEKQPILDEISQLRQVMIKECIHPVEQLAEQANGAITCKFCNKSFAVRK